MLRHHTPGQSLVELSLVATLLISLLLSSVDVALAFNTRMAIRQAVAEAGYYASQNPRDNAGIRARIHGELSWLSPALTDANISITRSGCSSSDPQTRVSVTYQHTSLFGNAGIGKLLNLNGETTVPQFGGC
jgi:Flp pilus assembly protein TadG